VMDALGTPTPSTVGRVTETPALGG
jgi:hypothetical protein